MRTIHAWLVDAPDTLSDAPRESTVSVPEGTEILDCRISSEGVQVVGLVPDLDADDVERTFLVSGHGHRDRIGAEFPADVGRDQYVGTASTPGGPSFHVFETTNVRVAA